MSLPWMTQLSRHGANSKSSIKAACRYLLEDLYKDLRRRSRTDPGRLSLISIGPTGKHDVVATFEMESNSASSVTSHELLLELFNGKGDKRIAVGVLVSTGLDLMSLIKPQTRSFAQLTLLSHLYREAVLAENVRQAKLALRIEGSPHNIQARGELREILERFTAAIGNAFADHQMLCYLRRSYLPYETGDGRWKKRQAGYAIRLPSSLATASQQDWERFWDARGDALLGGIPAASGEPALAECLNFPLLVPPEGADEEGTAESDEGQRAFYGALVCFSGPPHGYLESERTLLKNFAEDLAVMVRDCEIQHRMALHDSLVFELNLVDNAEEVLVAAARWLRDMYCPTEIAVLRLEGNHLTLVYSHGIEQLNVPPLDIMTEPGGVLRAARERKVDYIPNTNLDPNYLCVNPATLSQLAVPLYTGEIVMGVLLLGFPVVNAVGPADRLLILACAFRIAAALWRTEKARSGAVVAHKIKELLPLVRLNLEMLAQTPEEDVERSARILQRTLSLIQYWEPRITSLVHAIYHDVARGLDRFDLLVLLEKVVAVSAVEAETCQLKVTMMTEGGAAEPYEVRGREDAIEMAFHALVGNALEAMSGGNGTGVRLVVSQRTSKVEGQFEKRFVVVCVEDDGPGIPPENEHLIFEPLFSTKSSTGLGLFIARGVFEGAGGRLKLLSGPERREKHGATFEVILPISPSKES